MTPDGGPGITPSERDLAVEAIREALVHAVYPGLNMLDAKRLRDAAWDALALLAMERAE